MKKKMKMSAEFFSLTESRVDTDIMIFAVKRYYRFPNDGSSLFELMIDPDIIGSSDDVKFVFNNMNIADPFTEIFLNNNLVMTVFGTGIRNMRNIKLISSGGNKNCKKTVG